MILIFLYIYIHIHYQVIGVLVQSSVPAPHSNTLFRKYVMNQIVMSLMKLKLNLLTWLGEKILYIGKSCQHNTCLWQRIISLATKGEYQSIIPTCSTIQGPPTFLIVLRRFLQKPNNLKSRSESCSNNKSPYTVKYLVAVALCGQIMFYFSGMWYVWVGVNKWQIYCSRQWNAQRIAPRWWLWLLEESPLEIFCFNDELNWAFHFSQGMSLVLEYCEYSYSECTHAFVLCNDMPLFYFHVLFKSNKLSSTIMLPASISLTSCYISLRYSNTRELPLCSNGCQVK